MKRKRRKREREEVSEFARVETSPRGKVYPQVGQGSGLVNSKYR
jgi:hypothetical protein